MNKESNNISGKLNELPSYKVSKEKDQEILKAINNLHVARPDSSHVSFINYFLTHFIMNTKKMAAVLAAVVLVVGVAYYNTQNSFAHYLEEAQESLGELQVAISDGEISDDENIEALIEDIVENTQKAAEKAEDMDDIEELKEAFASLQALHEEELETFIEATEVAEDEDLDETIEAAVESTNEGQKELEEARVEALDDEDEDGDHDEDEDGDHEESSDDESDDEGEEESSDDESDDEGELE